MLIILLIQLISYINNNNSRFKFSNKKFEENLLDLDNSNYNNNKENDNEIEKEDLLTQLIKRKFNKLAKSKSNKKKNYFIHNYLQQFTY